MAATNEEPGPLSSAHIGHALHGSTDGGQTLDFSQMNVSHISDDAIDELTKIGREEGDDEGSVTRIALVYNSLSALPASFVMISKLRYLNLKNNHFTIFPEVLCNMPSLEILDISRNKIRRLPLRPGTLRSLRVFSFIKNRIDRLPSYLSEFSRLRMLKIEHNPIDWPPARVLRRTQDGDAAMEAWIHDLQSWLRLNIDSSISRPATATGDNSPGHTPDMSFVTEDDRSVSRFLNGRPASANHSRAPSDESMNSASKHFAQSVPLSFNDGFPTSPPDPQSPNGHSVSLGGVTSKSSYEDFHNSLRDDTLLNGGSIHGRNASTSVMNGRSNSASAHLLAKKSLPDMRSVHLAGPYGKSNPQRRMPEVRRVVDEPAVPSLSNPISSPREPQPPSRPNARPSIGVAPMATAGPMDVERNSYFKRYSTLPLSSVSKTIPEPMLKVVDAIRGIFFAIGQMHSAIQHYTVFGSDERQATGILGRLMNGASDYMMKLMGALDRFDSLSRRGLPPPSVCKDLIETCQDNVATSIKVARVLNAQLKVLAGTDDLRFARTSLLMLHGAMAEVSNSWHAMAPHLEAIQPLLRDYRAPPVSRSHAAAHSTPSRSNIHPIAESPTSPSRVARSPNTTTGINGTVRPVAKTFQRRNAGSFSYRDVQAGRSLATASPVLGPDMSSHSSSGSANSSTTVIGSTTGLRSALRNPTASSIPSPSVSTSGTSNMSTAYQNSNVTHSRDNSVNSLSRSTPVASRPHPGTQPSLVRSRTSDLPESAQLVDRPLLTMGTTCDDALATLAIIEQELPYNDPGRAPIFEAVERTRVTAMTLKQGIASVRTGYSEPERRALYENARQFAMAITQLAMTVKPFTASISPDLRSNLQRLITSTRDYAILLNVSSFAPGNVPRAPSPAVNGDRRGPGHPQILGRSRSATATQEVAPSAGPTSNAHVPWSAMPHGTFRIPNLPPTSLAAQRFDEDDERPRRL